MNSDKMPINYANEDVMLYGAHYATLASDKVTYENPVAKFVLTYVTPNKSTDPYDNPVPKASTSNVINDDNLGTSSITDSNYIYLEVPRYFFYITKLEIVTNITRCHHGGVGDCAPVIVIYRKEYYKGRKFVVVNAGSEVDTPCIVGLVSNSPYADDLSCNLRETS